MGAPKPRGVCPWTHWLLAALAIAFLLGAAGQIFAGAAQATFAVWKADPVLKVLAQKASQVDEITLKRLVQKAYRDNGLYVPTEDVILTHRIRSLAQGDPEQRSFKVWIPLPIRVPWAGTFVYMWSRNYILR